MSTKANAVDPQGGQGRRTPLSLNPTAGASGGGAKQQSHSFKGLNLQPTVNLTRSERIAAQKMSNDIATDMSEKKQHQQQQQQHQQHQQQQQQQNGSSSSSNRDNRNGNGNDGTSKNVTGGVGGGEKIENGSGGSHEKATKNTGSSPAGVASTGPVVEKVKEKKKTKDVEKLIGDDEKKDGTGHYKERSQATPSIGERKVSTPTRTATKTTEKTSVSSKKAATVSTPTKEAEKSPRTAAKATAPTTPTTPSKRASIRNDDVEMEPLAVEPSPVKTPVAPPSPKAEEIVTDTAAASATAAVTADAATKPSATSTPGKVVTSWFLGKRLSAATTKPEVPPSVPDIGLACARSYSSISGRRSIRPLSEYTPQYRESYRRIRTELDDTADTNTSLNVTVGSDPPNNSSFSFFGRGRKREHTPPRSRTIGGIQTDVELSPAKRPRFEGIFNFSSPLTLLRNRFSKTTLQSSTPMKEADDGTEEGEVQNVSGVSIEEQEDGSNTAGEGQDSTMGNIEGESSPADEATKELDDKKLLDNPNAAVADDAVTVDPPSVAVAAVGSSKRGCSVM